MMLWTHETLSLMVSGLVIDSEVKLTIQTELGAVRNRSYIRVFFAQLDGVLRQTAA